MHNIPVSKNFSDSKKNSRFVRLYNKHNSTTYLFLANMHFVLIPQVNSYSFYIVDTSWKKGIIGSFISFISFKYYIQILFVILFPYT